MRLKTPNLFVAEHALRLEIGNHSGRPRPLKRRASVGAEEGHYPDCREARHAYINAAGIVEDRKGFLFRTARGHNGTVLSGKPMSQPDAWRMIRRRTAAAGHRGRNWLPHIPRHGNYHRAVNRSGGERYALAFFCDSNIDWPVAAVPTCVGPDKTAKVPYNLLHRLHHPLPAATYNVFGRDDKDVVE